MKCSPQPPFYAGTPETAGPETLKGVVASLAEGDSAPNFEILELAIKRHSQSTNN